MSRIVKKTIDLNKELTAKQIKQLDEAAKKPIVFDDDSPEYSFEELHELAKLAQEKRKEQKKEVVTLRLQHKTIEQAKAVGKGYTGFLSRLIENAINDKDMVARSL